MLMISNHGAWSRPWLLAETNIGQSNIPKQETTGTMFQINENFVPRRGIVPGPAIRLVLMCVVGACVRVQCGAPKEVVRLSNVTPELVDRYLVAGEPFVVTDILERAAPGEWKAGKWTCEGLRQRFPEEEIELFTSDKKTMKFREGWETVKRGVLESDEARTGHEADYASFRWIPVEDGEPNTDPPTGLSKRQLASLQTEWAAPYWLADKAQQSDYTRTNIQVFVGTGKGSGTRLHVDAICIPTFSLQLQGTKRWWLGPIPNDGQTFTSWPDLQQSLIDDGTPFEPVWETVLRPGEALFFNPGLVHGTSAEPGDCSLSASFQIPGAPQFYNWSLPLLSTMRETYPCFGWEWNKALTGDFATTEDFDSGSEKKWRSGALKRFSAMDRHGDGYVDHDDYGDFYTRTLRASSQRLLDRTDAVDEDSDDGSSDGGSSDGGASGAMARHQRMLHRLTRSLSEADPMFADLGEEFVPNIGGRFLHIDELMFFGMHDTDHDGVVSVAEFTTGYTRWARTHHGVQSMMTPMERIRYPPNYSDNYYDTKLMSRVLKSLRKRRQRKRDSGRRRRSSSKKNSRRRSSKSEQAAKSRRRVVTRDIHDELPV